MEVISLIKEDLAKIVKEKYSIKVSSDDIHVERPGNDSWGDYSSNVSMVLAKDIKQSPMEIAKDLSYGLSEINRSFKNEENAYPIFSKIDFKAPGFINFTLSKNFLLWKGIKGGEISLEKAKNSTTGLYRGQKVLVEYTDPNPFKAFHIGHLMTNAIGESLARLLEFNGAEVKRVNYQGDVGMHVAKSIWGIFKKLKEEDATLEDLGQRPLLKRIEFLGSAYALGSTSYIDDNKVQKEVEQINVQVYMAAQEMLIEEEGWKPVVDYSEILKGEPVFTYEDVKEVYTKGRAWSLEDFELLYAKLGTKFDFYYFESKVAEYGLNVVREYLEKGVFEEDQGAVIFRGEKYGLHTRVFLNSMGLPVYEAKDLGLAFLKYDNYTYDKSYIITANEVNDYFKVVLKAMEQTNPELAKKTHHLGHGVMSSKEGKMASRTGDVITGKTMLEDAKLSVLERMALSNSEVSEEDKEIIAEKLSVGAVKYGILKHNYARDIVYDKEQATSVTGDTGPYLQYTHARATSVLEKAGKWEAGGGFIVTGKEELEEKELSVLKHLVHFSEMAEFAAKEVSPSIVCGYLAELAQRFNAFYNDIPILSAEEESEKILRLYITKSTQHVIKEGLWLLGIEAPDRV